MASLPLVVLLMYISLILALAVGANEESFAPVIGAKRLTMRQAILAGSILIVGGAILLGGNVASTINHRITTLNLVDVPTLALGVLVAVAITMLFTARVGLPISSTHAMVGAIIGITLIQGGFSALNLPLLLVVVIGWTITPLFALLGAFFLAKIIRLFTTRYVTGFDRLRQKEHIFANLLLVAVAVAAFSRAANDVGNAIAPLLGFFPDSRLSLPLLIGGTFMGIGQFLLGRRVLRTISYHLVEFTAESAFSAQAATALVTFTAAFAGLPISGTHVLISSFIGTGRAYNAPIQRSTLQRIVASSLLTPLGSAALAIIISLLLAQLPII